MRGAQIVFLDCRPIEHPNLAAIEHIARLQLCLRRAGFDLALKSPDEELLGLLRLCGLSVQVQWQPEEGEQPGGV